MFLTIHWHLIYLCGIVLFNIPQDPHVIVLYEVDSNSLASVTTRSSNTEKGACLIVDY